MRPIVTLALALFLATPLLAQAPKQPPAPQRQAPAAQRQAPAPRTQLVTPKQGAIDAGQASYVLGYQIGASFTRQKVPLDPQLLIKGIQEGFAGAKAPMSEDEMEELLKAFYQQATARAEEQAKQDGAAFLAANAKAPGVKTTKSGLQYKVLKDGTGKTPKASDTVTTHYKGTLIDGSPFDSSYDRNEPASFPVDGVIKGWTEALQMMKEGSKWQLVIPSDLAYGPQGRPPVIPPNSTLVFEVELLKVGE
jgi:FKBP-type peptidyl-prolyl cis-trans isomerase FklB